MVLLELISNYFSMPNVSEIHMHIITKQNTILIHCLILLILTKRKSVITFGRYNRTIQFLPSLIPKRIFHLTLRMIFAIKVRRNICCYTQRNCCDAAILIFILWGKCNAFKFPFGVVRLRQRHAHFWYINGLTVPK